MIRELKTLRAVAREGTFAAAGKKIGLTQAAVSAQMKRLERSLGTPIFERSGRGSLLTARGEEILLQAEHLLTLYAQLGVSQSATATRRVTLGAIASLQRVFLPDILARFHHGVPECQSRIVPGLSMELLDHVDSGELDMAVLIRPPFSLHPDLDWTTLAREPFRLLVPEQLSGDDWRVMLESQPFIRYDRASFGGRQVERFLRHHHLNTQQVCEVDELDAILRLVVNRVGVALVPQAMAWERWPTGVRAVSLEEETFYREVGLIHRARATLGEPARTLAELISSQGHL